MWCVSNWTVGISLRGICPEPPSPQQPKQHVNIAAILSSSLWVFVGGWQSNKWARYRHQLTWRLDQYE